MLMHDQRLQSILLACLRPMAVTLPQKHAALGGIAHALVPGEGTRRSDLERDGVRHSLLPSLSLSLAGTSVAQDCWDTPVASGDLSDLSDITAGAMAAGGLDGSFFDSMGMPESTEMPLSAADIHLPVEWDEAQILQVIFMVTLYSTYNMAH